MRPGSLPSIVVGLSIGACASSPPTPPPPVSHRPPCASSAQIGEAYGVGGLASVFGRDSALATPPHLDEPLEGAKLTDVHLTHLVLGRGGKAEAVATFVVPDKSALILEGRTPVKGYGFELDLAGSAGVRTFWVGCDRQRPRHDVKWSFTLRDGEGRKSNTIEVPVECTGEEIPGPPPQLLDVQLSSLDLLPGGRANGTARFSGSAPVRVIASTTVDGYGMNAPIASGQTEYHFWVGCYKDRPAHLVTWKFRVRDTFGRESNIIEKAVACGQCP
jgi:hypothetical protein